MKVALAQTHIIWEDKEANERQALEYIGQAVKRQAEAVFFPEMSLTGFSMNTEVTAEGQEETLNRFRKIAGEYGISIGIGWTKKGRELAENHYSVIDGQGNVISDYVKIHPFSYADEDKFFASGSEITYFSLGKYRWSSFICYDLRFPELFQAASQKAEVILVPANWPEKREHHWKSLLAARAIENQCYILAVNCVGQINGTEYKGCSCGISPDGVVLDALEDRDGLLLVELEENVGALRESFPVKQDRRWSFYISEYGGKDDGC